MTRIPASHVYEGLVEVGQISPDKNQRAALALLDQLAVKLGLKSTGPAVGKDYFGVSHGIDQSEVYTFGAVSVEEKRS